MNVPVETSPVLDVAPSRPRSATSRRWVSSILALLLGLATAVVVVCGALVLLGGWYRPLETRLVAVAADPALVARTEKAQRRLAGFGAKGVYVVIDTYANRLRVLKDGEVQREAVCSTGSGTVLKDPESERIWVFDTPLGEHRVQRKVKNPIWVKPDWAFIEEGYQPPSKGSRDRYDDFSLGDYALYLGDGYLIHGTVFQSLLGRRVTHGCIRLGDTDLEYVYKTVPLGARVYIF